MLRNFGFGTKPLIPEPDNEIDGGTPRLLALTENTGNGFGSACASKPSASSAELTLPRSTPFPEIFQNDNVWNH